MVTSTVVHISCPLQVYSIAGRGNFLSQLFKKLYQWCSFPRSNVNVIFYTSLQAQFPWELSRTVQDLFNLGSPGPCIRLNIRLIHFTLQFYMILTVTLKNNTCNSTNINMGISHPGAPITALTGNSLQEQELNQEMFPQRKIQILLSAFILDSFVFKKQ